MIEEVRCPETGSMEVVDIENGEVVWCSQESGRPSCEGQCMSGRPASRGTLVEDVMERSVLTANPEMSLRELAEMLEREQVSGLPVVDARGRVLGLVTLRELALEVDCEDFACLSGEDYKKLWQGRAETSPRRVSDIMVESIPTVRPEDKLIGAVNILLEKKLHRLVVTDHEGVLRGLLTSHILLRKLLDTLCQEQ